MINNSNDTITKTVNNTNIARTIKASDGKVYTFSVGRDGAVYNGTKGKAMLVTLAKPVDKINHKTQKTCLVVGCENMRGLSRKGHSTSDMIDGYNFNMLCQFCQMEKRDITDAWKLTTEGKPISKLQKAQNSLARQQDKIKRQQSKITFLQEQEQSRARERAEIKQDKSNAVNSMKAWQAKQ